MLELVPKRRDVSTGSSAGSSQLWDLCPIPGMSFPPGPVSQRGHLPLLAPAEPRAGTQQGSGVGRRRFGDGEKEI